MNTHVLIACLVCSFTLLVSSVNFASAQTSNSSQKIQDVVYAAKFVCGSISDNSGPLRPGHYDTSINVLNKKAYTVGILWNAVINDGPSSIGIFKNLEPEKSTALSCRDIKEVFGIETRELVEGFALIKVPLASLRGFGSQQIIPESQDALDMLDVQVFYTANALETLPHEVVQEKISFYIIQDGTGKIPKDSYRKLLDITIPSTLNEITDTEQKVKSTVAKKFGIDKNELEKIRLRIKSISVGVGALLDDHAVSLHVVRPQFN
ncbi:MAG TPA: hypothetical protein VNK25_00765 [Candidatus Nitrosotenuis sp.]|nr:hypothetical protein [Candidatus Nitrosotenuis sp.]